jgi:hypothetical protein
VRNCAVRSSHGSLYWKPRLKSCKAMLMYRLACVSVAETPVVTRHLFCKSTNKSLNVVSCDSVIILAARYRAVLAGAGSPDDESRTYRTCRACKLGSWCGQGVKSREIACIVTTPVRSLRGSSPFLNGTTSTPVIAFSARSRGCRPHPSVVFECSLVGCPHRESR